MNASNNTITRWILVLLFILNLSLSFAQNTDPDKSPAGNVINSAEWIIKELKRRMVDDGWKDQLKIGGIERDLNALSKKIEYIKKNDPSWHKIASYEKELSHYNGIYDAHMQEANQEKEYSNRLYMARSQISDLKEIKTGCNGYLNRAKLFSPDTAVEALLMLPNDVYAADVKSFLNEYPEYYERNIRPEIYRQIDEAEKFSDNIQNYHHVESNTKGAFACATAAKMLAPHDHNILTTYKEIKKRHDDIVDKHDQQTFTSAFHKKHVGEIVFFNRPVKIGEESEDMIVKDFNINDNVYAIAYFDKPANHATRDGWFEYNLSQNGRSFFESRTPIAKGEGGQTYLMIEVFIPNPEESSQRLPRVSAQMFPELVTGTHKFSLQLDRYAEGQFEFTVNSTDGPKLKTIASNYHEYIVNNTFMPNAAVSEPSLEKSIMNMHKSRFTKTTPLKVNILTGSWDVYHHEFSGEILYRIREVAVSYKVDGKCFFIDVKLRQDHLGGGRYGEIYYDGFWDDQELNCNNLYAN
ncbi:MAG: hypothetical protein MRY83_17940 [Flavobacteriales bacterium]|nr:hypothetical protein [Flavobacteriales bacterium]